MNAWLMYTLFWLSIAVISVQFIIALTDWEMWSDYCVNYTQPKWPFGVDWIVYFVCVRPYCRWMVGGDWNSYSTHPFYFHLQPYDWCLRTMQHQPLNGVNDTSPLGVTLDKINVPFVSLPVSGGWVVVHSIKKWRGAVVYLLFHH